MNGRSIGERFVDVAEEPSRWFVGLHDYVQCPIVSLKQSIEPIKSFLHDIESVLERVEENCRQPADRLSPDESGSIYLYTIQWATPHRSLSSLLNERLRSKNRQALTPWFPYLKLFFTALYKLPQNKGTIWRGARGDLRALYGVDHVWWGLSSCFETYPNVEMSLSGESIRTIFQIECLFGKSIQNHSSSKEDNEVILLPGTYFQVIAKWQGGKDLYFIQIRERPAPFVLFTPPFHRPTSASMDKQLSFGEKKPLANQMLMKSTEERKKWKQKGLMIVGENGQGHRLDQIGRCSGMFLDEDRTMFIADEENHRVVRWRDRAKNGETIADDHCRRDRRDRLNCPCDVHVDPTDRSIVIADRGNRRIVRCSGRYKDNEETLIDDVDCAALTCDRAGSIFFCDYEKNEVKKWTKKNKKCSVVAGGNGQGHRLNQFSGPTHLFVDEEHSIFVSDSFNHRVMKWTKGANEGVVVAGGNGPGDEFDQLNHPRGIEVDRRGHLYVADWANNRVVRWIHGDLKGSVVVGGNGRGKEINQFTFPTNLTFDHEDNLYVLDSLNFRIQKFLLEQD